MPDETTPQQPDGGSTPDDNPYAPPAPDSSGSEPTQQLPAEGQPPSYGPPPSYGQAPPPPAYGQPPAYPQSPGYGAQQPTYGQPPVYGQPPAYGQAPAYGQPYAGYPRTSGRATAVLILGIASIVLSLGCIGFITAIVALVLAPGAQRDIEASQGGLTGLGQVKAGRICAFVGLGLTVLAIIAVIGLGIASHNSGNGDFNTGY